MPSVAPIKSGGRRGSAAKFFALITLAAIVSMAAFLPWRRLNVSHRNFQMHQEGTHTSTAADTHRFHPRTQLSHLDEDAGSGDASFDAPNHHAHDDDDAVNALRTTAAGGERKLPPSNVASKRLQRITNANELHAADGKFVRLYHPKLRMWLSRAIDTNVDYSDDHQKILKLTYHRHRHSWTIKGHTRLFLTRENSNRLALDRKWERSYEQWQFYFLERVLDEGDGSESYASAPLVALQSNRNLKYVVVFRDSQSLMATAADAKDAAKWELFLDLGCSTEVQCWGEKPALGRRINNNKDNKDSDDEDDQRRTSAAAELAKELGDGFPLFGSPKSLKELRPQNSNDPYDSYLIARRTMVNWGSLPLAIPIIITDDVNTISLVNELNSIFDKNRSLHDSSNGVEPEKDSALQDPWASLRWTHIQLENNFEVHKKFAQPTYRGLFHAALTRFPDAPVVMYSNSDILYTPALSETIAKVMQYVKREKQRVISKPGAQYRVKGWMVVGQRVNYDVPATWDIRNPSDPSWVRDIEQRFAPHGDLFQSNAEDFFIVSRGLFEWMIEIPEFVVGGVAFDNWIVARAIHMALSGEAIVVDASKTVVALHQNHNVDVKSSHLQPKSEYNARLAAREGGVSSGKTADAAYATERRLDGSLTVFDKHRLLFS